MYPVGALDASPRVWASDMRVDTHRASSPRVGAGMGQEWVCQDRHGPKLGMLAASSWLVGLMGCQRVAVGVRREVNQGPPHLRCFSLERTIVVPTTFSCHRAPRMSAL